MKDETVHVTQRAQIDQAIAMLVQAGEGYRIPLMRAAAEGYLSIVAARAGTLIPARELKRPRPTVVLLTDDTPDATGPGRWPQAQRLIRWSNAIILHATGGNAEHYAMIAASTVLLRRVLVVEMQHRHHAAWRRLVEARTPQVPVLSIVPPPGDQHPRGGAPEGECLH